ncbi:MAG TPA: ABC transporter permease subunit [Pseudonocardia sp.]
MTVFLDSLSFMAAHLPLLLAKTAEHLLLCAAAIGTALVIAVPLGLWLGHTHRADFLAVSISNLGRALPTLALIAILIGIVGLGFANVFTALVIICVPPVLTNAYLAVDQVQDDLVRAGRGMGLTGSQVLFRIELPLALPLLFAGVRTAVIYVIGSATIGGVVGAGGLGDLILQEAYYGLPGVIAAALWVAALAILADVLLYVLQRAVTPSGLRARPALP